MSLNNDFNLRRLERYLAVAWESGADPVVVLTKSDLCEDLPRKLEEVEVIATGVEILTTSSMVEDGCRQIIPYLTEGKTVAFVGSSRTGEKVQTFYVHLRRTKRSKVSCIKRCETENFPLPGTFTLKEKRAS